MTVGMTSVSLVLPVLALAIAATASVARAADPKLRADLDALSRRTVFFGHQSVGGNVLDGVRDLAAAEGVTVRIVEARTTSEVPAGSIGHAYVGENGKPASKLAGFEQAFASPGRAVPDVALVKFCYVDFDGKTDVSALFQQYQAALRGLQSSHPGTTFVHVTVPLTAGQGGMKTLAKRLLGRDTPVTQNARREQFNALLRKAYGGKEPVFDIALLESTAPDGKRNTLELDGAAVPMLVGAYTDDGGHLNEAGRRRVAREFVAFLAALPEKGTTPAPEAR